MTTYTTITNAEIDQDSPVTQPLMTALRDNPIAIAEADSSVALSLLPTVKLGTITLTGSSVSLTSLDLTTYRFVKMVVNGMSHNYFISTNASINSKRITRDLGTSAIAYGIVHVEVDRGQGFSLVGTDDQNEQARVFTGMLTSATTTITVTISAGAFDAGTIEVYGVK